MSLREPVIVRTFIDDLPGELFVGTDGLPELRVVDDQIMLYQHGVDSTYRPATFPAAWSLKYVLDPTVEPILFPAWQAIARIQHQIAVAQREADTEDRDRAQQREIDNRTAMEIDERRAKG